MVSFGFQIRLCLEYCRNMNHNFRVLKSRSFKASLLQVYWADDKFDKKLKHFLSYFTHISVMEVDDSKSWFRRQMDASLFALIALFEIIDYQQWSAKNLFLWKRKCWKFQIQEIKDDHVSEMNNQYAGEKSSFWISSISHHKKNGKYFFFFRISLGISLIWISSCYLTKFSS